MDSAGNNSFHIIEFGGELYKLSAKKEITDFIIPKMTDKDYQSFFSIGTNEKPLLKFNFDAYLQSTQTTKLESLSLEGEMSLLKEKFGEILLEKVGIPEILKNDELSSVFTQWLGEKKVSVLLMMNCWMMNLHTMYSLHKTVDCLVAPQGGISSPGYNYPDIIRFINDNKGIEVRDLAIACVTSCENTFAFRRAKYLNKKDPYTIKSWKIIAIDLQTKNDDGTLLLMTQLAAFSDLVNVLNFRIKNDPATELKYLLKYVRSVCYDFTENTAYMIDIINWCLSIKYADEDFNTVSPKLFPDIRNKIVAFRDATIGLEKGKSLVLSKSRGESLYVSNDPLTPKAVITLDPTGYSLFFPECSFNKNEKVTDNAKSDRLLKECLSNWKEFLQIAIDSTISF